MNQLRYSTNVVNMSMSIGRMDRRIELQEVILSQNEAGESIEVPVKVFDSWAEVREMRGSERHMSAQTVAQADTKFKIRWRPNVTAINRIIYNNKSYDITGVLEIGKQEGLELHAKARSE